jgi:hypothetical protein
MTTASVDKPARRVPISVTGNDQRPGGRRDQNTVDAVGELEMRCVRLKAWLTAKLHRLGEVDMCEVTLGQVDMVNQAPWDTSSYQVATRIAKMGPHGASARESIVHDFWNHGRNAWPRMSGDGSDVLSPAHRCAASANGIHAAIAPRARGSLCAVAIARQRFDRTCAGDSLHGPHRRRPRSRQVASHRATLGATCDVCVLT